MRQQKARARVILRKHSRENNLLITGAFYIIIIILLWKRRESHNHNNNKISRIHRRYNNNACFGCLDFQPEFFPDQEKKTYSLECHSRNGGCNHFHQAQPDLTRTVVVVPSCYEYPFTNDQNAYSLTRSCSEHHYDVPHHNAGGGSSTVTTATMAPPVPSVAPDSPNALSSSPESSHSLTSYTCSSKP